MIARSGGTGAMEWQLGGTSQTRDGAGERTLVVNVSRHFQRGWTYRAYRYPESDVPIPLNLP